MEIIYDSSYIYFGFTANESNGEMKPQCVILVTLLYIKASKIRKLSNYVTLYVSYRLIFLRENTHTIVENLMKPCLLKASEEVCRHGQLKKV